MCSPSPLHFKAYKRGAVTSGQDGTGFGALSRFLNAVCTLSPYLRGFPLGTALSSQPPGQAAEILGLILLLLLLRGLVSELELVPGRGAVMDQSS